MIQSLLWNREAVHFLCLNNVDLEQDTLTEAAWTELQSVVRILQLFLRSTLSLERKVPNLWIVIPQINYLASIYRYDITLSIFWVLIWRAWSD